MSTDILYINPTDFLSTDILLEVSFYKDLYTYVYGVSMYGWYLYPLFLHSQSMLPCLFGQQTCSIDKFKFWDSICLLKAFEICLEFFCYLNKIPSNLSCYLKKKCTKVNCKWLGFIDWEVYFWWLVQILFWWDVIFSNFNSQLVVDLQHPWFQLQTSNWALPGVTCYQSKKTYSGTPFFHL